MLQRFRLNERTANSVLRLKCLQRCSSGTAGEPGQFSGAKAGNFFQEAPVITNPFRSDHFLQRCLVQLIDPPDVRHEIFEDLSTFGDRLCNEIDQLGRQAELEPPQLRSFDAWGQRTDELVTSQAWKDLHSLSAEEGLVALAYERNHGHWSRVHQFVKLLLFAPSAGLYTCPLAMTDGAAKLIEVTGNEVLKRRTFPRLTTRSAEEFWTSGQWMTEKKGGSDVGGGTDTVAKGPFPREDHPFLDNVYQLYGYKWFSSATDAQVAFTLARVMDSNGLVTKGSNGLSLFYLETRNEDGCLNSMQIQCLKNKLGTRQLPTAEMLLEGTEAHLIGEKGSGIVSISPMLNVTRLHNSVVAVGYMRRMMQLCADYATRRRAFGQYLYRYPLHMHTLSQMEVVTRGCTVFVLQVSRLLARSECNSSTPSEEVLLRFLVPLLKLYTAKQAVCVMSEGLEAFGGQGYIEDTGLPAMLRDAQVLPIWEGTTNILSLDLIRVITKYKEELIQIFHDDIIANVAEDSRNPAVEAAKEMLKKRLKNVNDFMLSCLGSADIQMAARDLAFELGHVYIGSMLIGLASRRDATECDANTAIRWCHQPVTLRDLNYYSETKATEDIDLVMNGNYKNITS